MIADVIFFVIIDIIMPVVALLHCDNVHIIKCTWNHLANGLTLQRSYSPSFCLELHELSVCGATNGMCAIYENIT